MTNGKCNGLKTLTCLITLAAAVACGEGFTAADSARTASGAGEGGDDTGVSGNDSGGSTAKPGKGDAGQGDAGETTSGGSDSTGGTENGGQGGTATTAGTGGSSGGGVGGTATGGSSAGTSSGGTFTAGTGGTAMAGSGGTATAGSGGTSTAGSGGTGGSIEYGCKVPSGSPQDSDRLCMKRLCGALKYECGRVEDRCPGDEKPCGYNDGEPYDCSQYLPEKSCPTYTACGDDHQCGSQCERVVQAQDKCHKPDPQAPYGTFSYECVDGVKPGACIGSSCECTEAAGSPGVWCCAQNADQCRVKYVALPTDPACASKPYIYNCSLSSPGGSCAPAPSLGANSYCCSTADVE